MLSKEEIEKGKAHLWWMLDNGIFTSEDEPHIEAVLEYIEQLEQEKVDRINADNYEDSYITKLESDKQKLIEKLEKDKYIIESTYSQINGDYFMAQDKLDYIKEILKILKGEKE